MNVFVLCTGRCGSMTFIRACEHIENYTAGHESRAGLIGNERFDYPVNHIEADNRLSWLLGRLDEKYGDKAYYIHLFRGKEETACSYAKRYNSGIIKAYREGVLIELPSSTDPVHLCRDYYDTVNSNIKSFLKDKTHKMDFRLSSSKKDFEKFWKWIGAKGDLRAALMEWDVPHNASVRDQDQPGGRLSRSLSDSKTHIIGIPFVLEYVVQQDSLERRKILRCCKIEIYSSVKNRERKVKKVLYLPICTKKY